MVRRINLLIKICIYIEGVSDKSSSTLLSCHTTVRDKKNAVGDACVIIPARCATL